MSRYRKPSQTRRSYGKERRASLGWLWLLSGVFVGALGAVFIYERFTHLKPNNDARIARTGPTSAVSKTHTNKAQAHAQSPNTDKKASQAKAQTVQEFEFYTLLPGMEVQVPEHAAQKAPQVVDQSAKIQPKGSLQNSSTKNPRPPQTTSITTRPSNPTSPIQQGAFKKTPGTAMKTPSATQVADTKRYIIEAGMFRDFGQADSLKAKLALQGFNPHIQKVMTERGETWFRVALGPYYSESLANTQKQSLQALKVRGIVIVHKNQ